VELCHCAGLVRLQVLQVEAPHEEILAPDVLRDKVYLHPTGRNKRVSAISVASHISRMAGVRGLG